MTPSMNMAAPKGTQAPQAGLAAIAQPAQAPRGKSPENMGQVMALARKMSDSQLADVLAGKSLDVPQYVAMTEAMGRKQLRNAMQGAQAMAQAKQPSVKDKLMAEQQAEMMPQIPQGMPQEPVMAAGGGLMYADGGAIDMNETAGAGGIADLPAPNMMPMTMADGGIVAFDEGGLSREDVDKAYQAWQESKGPWYLPTPKGSGAAEKEQAYKDMLRRYQMVQGTAAQMAPRTTPTINSTPTQDEINNIRASAGPAVAGAPAAVPPSVGGAKKSGLEALLTPQDDSKKAAEDYLAKLAGLGEKTRGGISDIKNQAQSQVLLDTASALLSSRNLAEAGGKAGQLVAGRVGSMGKDMRAAEKEANEYDLNLAKARAALEAGDKDRAMQYEKMALENKYHMAMVNKPDSGIALLNALRDPKMMELYQQMNLAKKPTDTLDREKAATLWEKMSRSKQKEYGDFDTYYRTMNNQLLSATIPGEGATVRSF